MEKNWIGRFGRKVCLNFSDDCIDVYSAADGAELSWGQAKEMAEAILNRCANKDLLGEVVWALGEYWVVSRFKGGVYVLESREHTLRLAPEALAKVMARDGVTELEKDGV